MGAQPQQGGVTFQQFISANPAKWNGLNAEDRRALAAAAYDLKDIKSVGDAAQSLSRQDFINQASQYQLPMDVVNRQSLNAGNYFLNSLGNQLSLDRADLPEDYSNIPNAVAGFGGRLAGGFAQDLSAGAVGGAVGGAIGGLPGAAIGYGLGQFGSGALQGYFGAVDRYDDAGKPLTLRNQLGAITEGLGYGALNVVAPGFDATAPLLKQLAKTTAAQGLGTAGVDVSGQLIGDGQVDWQRAAMAGAVGAGGGAAGVVAGRTMQAAKRYQQGLQTLQVTMQNMMGQPSAPIGLGGIPPINEGLPPINDALTPSMPANGVDPAQLTTSIVVPEGQAAGSYPGEAGPVSAISPDDAAQIGQVLDQQIASRNTKAVEEIENALMQIVNGNLDDPNAAPLLQKADDYLRGSQEEIASIGAKVKEAYRSRDKSSADELLKTLPETKRNRVKNYVDTNVMITKKETDRIAADMYGMMKRGQGESSKNLMDGLNTSEKRAVVDEINALKRADADMMRVRNEQIKQEEEAKHAKMRDAAAYEQLEASLAKAEEKKKQFTLSQKTEDLDAIAASIVETRAKDGKNQGKVELDKIFADSEFTKKDKAYVKDAITRIERENRAKALENYRKSNKPVPKDATQELLALAKEDASNATSIILRANADQPAMDFLESMGYAVNRASDGYGRDTSRRVFMGGKVGTVVFEAGDTLGVLAKKVEAKGGDIGQFFANRLVKNSQESGMSVYELTKQQLGEANALLETDIAASEAKPFIDQMAASAERQARIEMENRDNQYYQALEDAAEDVQKRLRVASTPEEAVAAFEYYDRRTSEFDDNAQEYIFAQAEAEYQRAMDMAYEKTSFESVIDKAITTRQMVTLEGVAMEEVGITAKVFVGDEAVATDKTFNFRSKETILAKEVMVDGNGRAYAYIRTLDKNGQFHMRYLYDSPNGSKIGKMTISDEVSPYTIQEIDGKKVVVGPDGIVGQVKTAEFVLSRDMAMSMEKQREYAAKMMEVAKRAANNEMTTADFMGFARESSNNGFYDDIDVALDASDAFRQKLHKDITGEPC